MANAAFTIWFDTNTGACLGVGDEDGPLPAPDWTLDDLNEPYQDCPWHARSHSLTREEATRLAAIVGVAYSEKFRLEIGVAIQFTVERLLHGHAYPFAALERAIDYRDLGSSLDALATKNTHLHAAAVTIASTLDWAFGERWSARITAKMVRAVRTWITDQKKKRGRQEEAAIVDFYGALFDTVRALGGGLALPSNQDADERVTPLMAFCIACAQKAHAIGDDLIAARVDDACPAAYRMTADQSREAAASLKKLKLSNRALCDRLRTIRQETEIKGV